MTDVDVHDLQSEAARNRDLIDRITRQPEFAGRVIELAAKVMEETDFSAIQHTRQVTSGGGVGTTALLLHLQSAGVDLPTTPDCFPFKHQTIPPDPATVPDDFRVVFVYDDPRDAAISLFRKPHFDWMRPMIAGNSSRHREALESVESYARVGEDVFGFAAILRNWLDHPGGYPVLFLRFSSIAETWPTVADFVGLPADHPCVPVLERRPRDPETEELREGKLYECYCDLIDFVDQLPPVFVVP